MKPQLVFLLLPIGAISEDKPPIPKDGLWSIHTVLTDHPSEQKGETQTSYCKSHEQEARTSTKQPCKVTKDTVSGETHIKETECNAAGRIVTMTATTTGDSSVRAETRTVFDPPSAGRKEITVVTDEKYVGACPTGVNPGDILDASGKVVHHGK